MRCSTWVRENHVDPIGTAGSYAGYLLVEWPLPWPADLVTIPALAPVHAAAARAGFRVQGVIPLGGHGEEARSVVRYDRGDGDGFVTYQRTERSVPVDEVVDAAVDLAQGGAGGTDAGADEVVDVLVCAHGTRDVCCGSRGTALTLEVASDPALSGPGVRLCRTSHTGGHRFAPTAIVLPQGTVWAYVEAEHLRRIVHRDGPLAELAGGYRGSAGMDSAAVQAVEREAFVEVGWDWLAWRRWSEPLGDDRVRVTGEAPDGRRRSWEATVSVARLLPVPACGQPLEAATKTEPELLVSDLRSTSQLR